MTDFGPCADWPIYWNCPEAVSTASPTATGYAVTAATEILWALSGRKYGVCEVTIRPCRQSCENNGLLWDYPTWSGLNYSGPYFDWYWLPQMCGACGNTCSCNRVPEVELPSVVSRIVTVKVDGSPLATGGAYRVDDNRFLVRTDGQDWPRCNNLLLDDTQPGTWSVTAEYGQEVPTSGRLAMGEMACEILRAMSGENCRLPAGVTQLIRQGITIQYPDVGALLKDGRTGLYLVDLFLTSENPYNTKQRPRVYSVDSPRQRRAGT
jgi:hypothetical protein